MPANIRPLQQIDGSHKRARRINVAVSPDSMDAIERIIQREDANLTESVRRLLAYGDLLYRAVKEDGATVVLRFPDGHDKEIALV